MSTLTTTFPGAGLDSPPRAAILDAKSSRGFWWTLGWFVLAIVAMVASEISFIVLYRVWAHFTGLMMNITIEKAILEALFICPIVLVLCIAVRRAGWSRTDLGLTWPRWRYLALALGLFVAEVILNFGLAALLTSPDEPGDPINLYAMGGPFALVMMFLSMVIFAPLWEEFAFRGFLMRGWMHSRLGVTGAIVLSALVFMVVHGHVTAFPMISLFVGGCLMAFMRWLSGSIVPAMLMHALWNGSVFILIVVGV